jgi:uncharacterized membrane protein
MRAPITQGSHPATRTRLTAIDALRGLVMVIMALDHTRDFFHADAMAFQPEDLARTTPLLFFTRWVTHICAPVFMFLAGMSAFLRLERSGSKGDLSRFLLTRGLWLVLIEITVMRLAMNFTADMRYPVLLLVLTALGIAMVALAALIHLPFPVLVGVSAGIVLVHNTLDGVRAADLGGYAGLWRLIHEPGPLMLGSVVAIVAYPVLPWIGVMAAGFCAGRIMSWPDEERRRTLVRAGLATILLFLIVRGINGYGDPQPWSPGSSPLFTVLSFLRTTKYPPSLAFVLMTLGPALLLLAAFDRRPPRRHGLLVAVGRVPFFYYVVHFWLIHVLASVMAFLRYGRDSLSFLFVPPPVVGGPREMFPADYGHPLWVAYAIWILVVLVLYPACRWFARLKDRRRAWWTSYV